MIKGGDRVVGGFKFKSKWEQKMRKKKKKGRYQKSNAPPLSQLPISIFLVCSPSFSMAFGFCCILLVHLVCYSFGHYK